MLAHLLLLRQISILDISTAILPPHAHPLEINHTFQTSNLLRILRHHISHNRILPLRHLLRDLDRLVHAHRAIQRAFEVDVGDLVAEVGGLVDQGDEAIFDGESDFGARFDGLVEDARGAYVKAGATEREGG